MKKLSSKFGKGIRLLWCEMSLKIVSQFCLTHYNLENWKELKIIIMNYFLNFLDQHYLIV